MSRRLAFLPLVIIACSSSSSKDSSPSTSEVGTSIFALADSDFANTSTVHVATSLTATGDCTVDSGVTLDKGAIYSTRVTGALSGYGPAGDVAVGGVNCPLINRPVAALFACIGANRIPIGVHSTAIAPEAGPLRFGVNACSGIALSGGFDVKVMTNATKSIGELPRVTDRTIQSTKTFTMDVAGDWQKTGATVARGQKIFVDATGTLTSAKQFQADPDGIGAWGGTSSKLVNRFAYRLYARVGTDVIDVGRAKSFLAPADGEVEVIVNHANDVTGSFEVKLGLGIVPARGLSAADLVADPGQDVTTDVTPTGAWMPTTIALQAGDPIVISATGQTTTAEGAPADAYGVGANGGTSYALVNRPVLALFGRVGSSTFYVGGESVVLSPAAGNLELIVNAPTDGSIATNGKYTARVHVPSP